MTALCPISTLSSVEAHAEWEKATRELRKDGARPKETDKGIVMVTSLANFRSDFTIVHISRGNFLEIQERLYANINVLRMGCSGRSALTLEDPSDTTKDRFISSYHLPDQTLIRSSPLFTALVLELVRLIQAALSLFGMFDLDCEERNGLLCDVTCEGIQRWVTEIGDPLLDVEPMERVADPTVVAALFSTVLVTRNRLHVMGHFVTKDPFLDPHNFLRSIMNFASPKVHNHAHSLSLPHHFVTSNVGMYSVPSIPTPTQTVFLTRPIIDSINAAYDKMKQNEGYKVHRVLINKLDDLATDLRTNPDPGGHGKTLFGWANSLKATTDLEKFVSVIRQNSKAGCGSVKYLWSGRPGEVERKRKEKEAIWSEGEDKEREKEMEKEKDREKEKEKEKERFEKDFKSSDDEDELPWSGRVQRKLENWTARGRPKKYSQDLGGRSKGADSLREQALQSSLLPSVVVSRDPADDDDVLTSGQASPVSDSQILNPFTLGIGELPRAGRSMGELSDYDRRVSEFNQRNPPPTLFSQARVVSWADPKDHQEDLRSRSRLRKRGASPLAKLGGGSDASKSRDTSMEDEWTRSKTRNLQTLKKRRSFDDADSLRGTRLLPLDLMRIDVELCGQILIMRRREEHLDNVLACLSALTLRLSETNSTIRQEYTSKAGELEELKSRASVLQDIEAAQARADAMTQETNALAYESAQFLVDDLWHMAAAPRNKVLQMREQVFGTGRRLPQGVKGAHGRYNRLQWTLDGTGRLVDVHGRTESEAEEEMGLPRIRPIILEEEEDAVEHASLKPTWLLRWFNYWGSRWGASRGRPMENNNDKEKDKVEEPSGSQATAKQRKERGKSSSVSSSTSGLEPRLTAVRNNTT
ncbi:hypothetical protein PHLGIDRAFT_84823 [Phlebiopsis gigantea 11061_1 CR5-6]|uniref:STB6-like N-terminal domain-containing protein n=1 Tax=Phlebiopsis gigantea (strain 11061_1 CR5-6) TaxID=745531 RepID=A0A0C3SC41_PHLG1|nr:hypothetical protein PHLGIDRAFT_84823 [Phlebiopsis gigantea 11061_1 CR5-6]